MKNSGLILINAFANENTRQYTRIRDALLSRGVNADIRKNDGFFARVVGGKCEARLDCDFCVYLDKDKYISRILEKTGMRLFNGASAIENCDDKMTTHIMLADNGIAMPDTLAGLLYYDGSSPLPLDAVAEIERSLGYPVVIKQSYGSMGKGVFKADNRDELIAIAEKIKCTPHLFQRYIASARGKDLRVIVIGGKTIGGIERSSAVDFRSNIGLGGKAKRAIVPKSVAKTAEKAASVLGLDYCGIDFLPSDEPLLCEINSNAFFDAFEAATGIDVAGAYADHIVKTVYGAKSVTGDISF